MNQSHLKVACKNFMVGSCVAVTTQPLEVMRTAYIHGINTKFKFKLKIFQVAYNYYHLEGLKGIYRGTSLAVCKNGISSILFFGGIENFRVLTKQLFPNYNQNPKGFVQNLKYIGEGFMNAAMSKFFATSIVTPIILLKTRKQVLNQNTPIFTIIKQLYQKGGISNLFKGIIPTLLRDVPWSGLQYAIYKYFLKLHDIYISRKKSNAFIFISGSFSSIIATIVTFPFDNIRVRIQLQKQRKGILSVMIYVIKKEGLKGLFRGATPRLMKKGMSGGVLWIVYKFIWNKQQVHS